MNPAPRATTGQTPGGPLTERGARVSGAADTMQRAADGGDGPRSTFETLQSGGEIPADFVCLKKMVHDLRDPLCLILLAAERALRGAHNASVVDALLLIREESLRAENIMQGTIMRATGGGAPKAVGNLNTVAQRAVATAQRYCDSWTRNRVTWGLELIEPAPRVPMHAVAIEQVIVNLVKNAVEAGGRASQILVRTVNTSDLAEVIVSDNGEGIPREVLAHVFERFVSTKRATTGRGLGLSICSEIVTDHGGQILVESEVGRGSVFTIQLPRATGMSAGESLSRHAPRPEHAVTSAATTFQ